MSTPAHLPHLDAVLELAALEHDPARWDAQLDALRADDVPMNDGPTGTAPAPPAPAAGTGGEGAGDPPAAGAPAPPAPPA
ncbi:MAG: hypothetical protein F2817_04410, partial [Actinobacteria bacterium]|nr:hypothetical protein [Actinomycetota bacterium]